MSDEAGDSGCSSRKRCRSLLTTAADRADESKEEKVTTTVTPAGARGGGGLDAVDGGGGASAATTSSSDSGNLDAVVTLNVGGTLFCTTRRTLRNVSSSVLGRMFGGEFKEPDGIPFVDVNPSRFSYILDYYRYLDAGILTRSGKSSLLHDARYLGLDRAVLALEAWYGRCEFCGKCRFDLLATAAAAAAGAADDSASSSDKVCDGADAVRDHLWPASIVQWQEEPSKLVMQGVVQPCPRKSRLRITVQASVFFDPSSRGAKARALAAEAALAAAAAAGGGGGGGAAFAVTHAPSDIYLHVSLPEQRRQGLEDRRMARMCGEREIRVAKLDKVVQCGFHGCTFQKPTCPGQHKWNGASMMTSRLPRTWI
jgi:hypothetical protein